MTIEEEQRRLLQRLEAQARDEAVAQRVLVAQRENENIFVHPGTQRPYRWVGNKLVPIGPRYIDGLGSLVERVVRGIADRARTLKERYDAHQEYARGYHEWKEGQNGLGYETTDRWGMKVTGMPIRAYQESELEEELERVRRAEAPWAKEFIRPGIWEGFSGVKQTVNIYRLDNLITGKPCFPTYAIAYRTKFGTTELATGKRHIHLAVDAYRRALEAGKVAVPLATFNARDFGYDMQMFVDTSVIEGV